ncbi:MAG: DUF4435 domain-containing protein [Burkholderiaceae bacterium]|nr:MAG: DUF4435 domain-containing protein [Burkholderiaceae bacterium]
MKKQDITFQDKYDEMLLEIAHPNNSEMVFVFVEGDTDVRIFRKLFSSKKCKVESIPGGNPKVEECTEKISEKIDLVFGIRDADFIHLGGEEYSRHNVFLSDFHDVEVTFILEDEIFSSILLEHSNLPVESHPTTRQFIVNAISDVSYLKWLNSKEDLEFCFSPITEFIPFNESPFNVKEYFLERVLNKSSNPKIRDFDVVASKIENLKSLNPHPFYLCNGHDFIIALALFLRTKHAAKNVTENSLASAFRIAFTFEHWKRTKLYQQIEDWSRINSCSLYETAQ